MNTMLAQVCPAPGEGFVATGSIIVLLATAGVFLLPACLLGRVAWSKSRRHVDRTID